MINHDKFKKAQSTIEFTFAMVVTALLIYGLIKVFQWVGMDYAQQAYIQRNSLAVVTNGSDTNIPRTPRLNAFTRGF